MLTDTLTVTFSTTTGTLPMALSSNTSSMTVVLTYSGHYFLTDTDTRTMVLSTDTDTVTLSTDTDTVALSADTLTLNTDTDTVALNADSHIIALRTDTTTVMVALTNTDCDCLALTVALIRGIDILPDPMISPNTASVVAALNSAGDAIMALYIAYTTWAMALTIASINTVSLILIALAMVLN
jgi:hypothetical protein